MADELTLTVHCSTRYKPGQLLTIESGPEPRKRETVRVVSVTKIGFTEYETIQCERVNS